MGINCNGICHRYKAKSLPLWKDMLQGRKDVIHVMSFFIWMDCGVLVAITN